MTATATRPTDIDCGRCVICRDPSVMRLDGHWMHPCCDYWARRGHSRCVACTASRAAERRKKATA